MIIGESPYGPVYVKRMMEQFPLAMCAITNVNPEYDHLLTFKNEPDKAKKRGRKKVTKAFSRKLSHGKKTDKRFSFINAYIDIIDAINRLSQFKRDIIRDYYFLDMEEGEIAKKYRVQQQHISYHIKSIIGREADDIRDAEDGLLSLILKGKKTPPIQGNFNIEGLVKKYFS